MRSTQLNQEWVMGVGFDTIIFGTLTFDGKTGLSAFTAWTKLRYMLKLWLESVLRYFGPSTQVIMAVEQHQNHPYPHVHILIFHNRNVRQNPHKPSKYLSRPIHQWLKSSWSYGHTDFVALDKPHFKNLTNLQLVAGRIGYLIKYIGKTASIKRLLAPFSESESTMTDQQLQNLYASQMPGNSIDFKSIPRPIPAQYYIDQNGIINASDVLPRFLYRKTDTSIQLRKVTTTGAIVPLLKHLVSNL